MMNLCGKCNGTGWIYFKENGLDYAKECDCGLLESERISNKLKFANVPFAYKDAQLRQITAGKYTKSESKVAIRAVIQSIKYWLEHLDVMVENGKGLYLWSKEKGSGKTLMAAAISNELMNEYGKQVKFTTSMQIINEIKASWDKETGMSESKLLRDLSDVDYLVIDDFGTEQAKDWISERFYQIINSRYIERKITLFTSNYDVRDLPYDNRISNRILERSFRVHFPEESVREYIAKTENVIEGNKND